MKKLVIVVCLLALASLASAAGYQKGKTIVGPLVGFGWHDLMIGAQGEYGFADKISGGIIGGWSSKSEDFYYGKWNYTYISIGAQGNYHFKPGEKFDPFLGAVLGYDIVSYSTDWAPGYGSWYSGYSATGSAMFIGGNLGCNYDFSPTMLGRLQVGYPFYFAGGISFKF